MIDLFLLVLAVFRISLIISSEEFAFGLAAKMREKFGVLSHVAVGTIDVWDGAEVETLPVTYRAELPSYLQPTLLARGVTCLWCVSFWVGIVWGVLYWIAPELTVMGSLPFALSAAAIVLKRFIG